MFHTVQTQPLITQPKPQVTQPQSPTQTNWGSTGSNENSSIAPRAVTPTQGDNTAPPTNFRLGQIVSGTQMEIAGEVETKEIIKGILGALPYDLMPFGAPNKTTESQLVDTIVDRYKAYKQDKPHNFLKPTVKLLATILKKNIAFRFITNASMDKVVKQLQLTLHNYQDKNNDPTYKHLNREIRNLLSPENKSSLQERVFAKADKSGEKEDGKQQKKTLQKVVTAVHKQNLASIVMIGNGFADKIFAQTLDNPSLWAQGFKPQVNYIHPNQPREMTKVYEALHSNKLQDTLFLFDIHGTIICSAELIVKTTLEVLQKQPHQVAA